MSVVIESSSPEPGTAQPASTPQQRLIAGRFRLIEQLGRGGMGRVYRALDEVLNRPVAVKLIYDDAVGDRDLQHACALEARAAARLNHPGIVRILDSGFDDGHCYVVMSLAEGRTLAEILREDGPLAVNRALDLAIQVADALAAAHQEGVIHCDIKPGNLLVDADWRVRLVDFGIARVTSSTTGLTGELLQGSAQYVAPEQVEGASVDGRTDLYALGTVLYEMLAGRTPFGGGTIASVLARRLVVDPPSLRQITPAVPARVEQVIFRALARDPDERFQTAAELRDALMAIRHAMPMFPVPPRTWEQTGRLSDWTGAGSTLPARSRLSWDGSRRRVMDGAAYATDWTARSGRRAREVASAVLPEAMARAQLLTPARRPTLRAGMALAVLVGLLMGTVAAKCGTANVSAEAALALESAAQIRPTTVAAPPVPLQAPVIGEPVAQIAPPTATQPPPPTSVPPTATVPAPTVAAEPEPAVVEAEAPAAPPPPVQVAPAPAPPVRALSASAPALAAPVEHAASPVPAAPVEAAAVSPVPAAPPAPPADEPKKEPKSEDDGEKRRPLSNTPRSDEKTPEERQKAEAKQREPEKQARPPKQETKNEQRRGDDDKRGNKKQRDKDD